MCGVWVCFSCVCVCVDWDRKHCTKYPQTIGLQVALRFEKRRSDTGAVLGSGSGGGGTLDQRDGKTGVCV